MFKFAVLVGLVCASNALFSSSSKPDWDGLRVTFGVPDISGFTTMPRTVSDAQKAGFIQKDNQCEGTGNTFVGIRYQQANDSSIVLIFDINGYIAGIQTSPPKNQYTPTTPNINVGFESDGDYWSLTTYFVDPNIICTTGRSADDFKTEGTGTNLYIQNGTNPLTDSVLIPNAEQDIKQDPRWGNGKCLPGMGQHYWFNIKKNMSCDDFYPYCVLYSGGKLNAFCFAIDQEITPQNHYEHAYTSAANSCCIDAPDCFWTDPRHENNKIQSTLHVFMTEYPYLTNLCPL